MITLLFLQALSGFFAPTTEIFPKFLTTKLPLSGTASTNAELVAPTPLDLALIRTSIKFMILTYRIWIIIDTKAIQAGSLVHSSLIHLQGVLCARSVFKHHELFLRIFFWRPQSRQPIIWNILMEVLKDSYVDLRKWSLDFRACLLFFIIIGFQYHIKIVIHFTCGFGGNSFGRTTISGLVVLWSKLGLLVLAVAIVGFGKRTVIWGNGGKMILLSFLIWAIILTILDVSRSVMSIFSRRFNFCAFWFLTADVYLILHAHILATLKEPPCFLGSLVAQVFRRPN